MSPSPERREQVQAKPGPGGPGAGKVGPGKPGAGKPGAGKAGAGKPGPGGPGNGPGAQKPQKPLWPTVKRMLGYLRPHRRLLALVVLALLATTAVELAPPVLIRYGVDRLMLGGEARGIIWLAAGLFGLSIVQGAVDFARLYAMAGAGHRIVFGLRSAVFRHLSSLSFSFYDRARTGELMSRVTADIDTLSDFFGRAAVIVLTNILILLGILAVLFGWNWRLGLLFLAVTPLLVHGMLVYARQVRPAMMRTRRALAALTNTLQQSLSGILVVKLFGREPFEAQRADRQASALQQANIGAARVSALWMPYANVLMGVITGLVLWYGGRGVVRQTVSLGTLIAFTSYVSMLLRPIRQTGMMLNVMMRAAAAAERVFEVLDTEPEIRDAPNAYALPAVQGSVRYEGVQFSYDGEHDVLHDIALAAAPGEMVALVGASGSGKSTLVHLLPRFYDPQAGAITIDGHDIAAVTVESLRDAIGIALQTAFLFDTSVGDNFAYGAPDASRADIERVARDAQLHDFVSSLPMGYETPVGERGVRLSGGQRQRIALARVLLRDPRILILDEPTAAVDAETERQMQAAMRRARQGRTTFVIAHRLWTVQEADQILVLDQGRIVERAHGDEIATAHQQLVAAGGLYARLQALQTQAEALAPQEEVL